ncbi:hypothetical protein BDY19DRAFT_977191 [Irpex rosettiformis]|uniref:Uncharacterized protein n=1 Tax=Irpex rosettiformis TaxID=378272 RepID=A0ACB8TNP2_9APHY|nr:hypothetical protein BDY19DRAFT_977191 [Irpex rosettiformis]
MRGGCLIVYCAPTRSTTHRELITKHHSQQQSFPCDIVILGPPMQLSMFMSAICYRGCCCCYTSSDDTGLKNAKIAGSWLQFMVSSSCHKAQGKRRRTIIISNLPHTSYMVTTHAQFSAYERHSERHRCRTPVSKSSGHTYPDYTARALSRCMEYCGSI